MCDRKRQKTNTNFMDITTYDLQDATILCSSVAGLEVAKFTIINDIPRYIVINKTAFENVMRLHTMRSDGSWYDEYEGVMVRHSPQYFLQYINTPLCMYAFSNNDINVFDLIRECVYRQTI